MGNLFKLILSVFTIGVVSITPLAMIYLGSLHLKECPMQTWVPKFMVGAGGTGILLLLLTLCSIVFEWNKNNNMMSLMGYLVAFVTAFSFAWNIAGSVWVFQVWKNWDDAKYAHEGCDADMFLFALAYLIIFWITSPCQVGGRAKSKDTKNNELA